MAWELAVYVYCCIGNGKKSTPFSLRQNMDVSPTSAFRFLARGPTLHMAVCVYLYVRYVPGMMTRYRVPGSGIGTGSMHVCTVIKNIFGLFFLCCRYSRERTSHHHTYIDSSACPPE